MRCCDEVLARDAAHVKALLRRGTLRGDAGDLSRAAADLAACLGADPANLRARKQMKRVRALQKAKDAADRAAFGGVFDRMALGAAEAEEGAVSGTPAAPAKPPCDEGTSNTRIAFCLFV